MKTIGTAPTRPVSPKPPGSTGRGGLPPSSRRLARQRRPGWIAAGAMLLAFAVLTNVYLFRSAGQRVPVVRLTRDVAVGQPLSAADVDVARVAVDAGVATVAGRQLQQVVGKRAAVGLRKGALLTASQLTAQVSPAPGQALVTVPLKAGSVPPGLAPGWQVRVVFTTSPQGGGGSGAPARVDGPGDVAAVVDQVGEPDGEGAMSVSLLVSSSAAGMVARQAAAGLVVLVVTERRG